MPPAPQLIVLTNESTVLTDAQVSEVVEAMQIQLSGEFAEVWHQTAHLEFLPKASLATAPADAWQMIVLDNSDQAGALGYHSLTATGQPMGKVFAKTDITYDSSWTVTLSHELLEIVADPFCLLTATYQLQNGSIVVATVEVGDAVEADNFGYKIGEVLVSDFCYPAWWGLSGGTQYDRWNHASVPFDPVSPATSIPAGGYLAIWTQAGGWSQTMGGQEMKEGKAIAPPGSRRERRMRGQTNWQHSVSPEEVSRRRQALQDRLG